ncbi:MAG: sensor histidine kinase [Gemmatirosa sp.]|nr:sensor histidine kinase [Gemmatirosa sp.]
MSDRDLAARRLLAVTEEELQRVVLDIHDGPVQSLFAALGQLAALRERLGDAAASCAGPLGLAESLLEASLRDIRQIVTTLHAPEFTAHSVATLAEELAVQHEALTGHEVALDVAADLPAVAPIVKIAVYRVLQEALSNIRRHARSSTTTVRLSVRRACLSLEVEDDGQGFEPPPLVGPEATEQQRHVGLRGMRERAAMLGGTLTVRSRPGAGTLVRVRLPIDVGTSLGGR